MGSVCRWGGFIGVAMLALIWSAAVVQAQRPARTRNILVKPDQQLYGVDIALNLAVSARPSGTNAPVRSGEAVSVGEAVVICFSSSADGYVTIWSQDAEGNVPARIYPNEFVTETADDVAARVQAREETCIGDDDGFRLEVTRPLGEASVYMHYTRDMDMQFDETAFPEVRATREPDTRPYASISVMYDVVD